MNVFPGVPSFRDVATVGNTMLILFAIQIQSNTGEFPDGIGVRILSFHCRGPGSIPGQETDPKSCAA